ncbi:MAG: helix-turn-helix transcriptional regulator [Gammaproteobacteria bacterium]|nr:helix-turn-helix transcriptional regulator [Gammaproteobacteria bacterium]MCP4089522.1 helix-turn-helix transcriptional regulator [Gammaproteobacteria bacterium]MCP4276228.1 helix-turn-helix transcriptional regulator [Gammaproteobacteria bacterium]MCP4832925.1 helix-turn-helix transcriptional regulator [Gammaproteobacteria bacterium]MCP4930050.1 helix-turn-helix transcriptional regulator [Gammaproteobacteria bacterium]
MQDSIKPVKEKVKRDRKATEEAILAAFEVVLLREGIQGLGVNAVAQEAGVNKVLIYRYFQDFNGLARQWVGMGSFWPSELELIGGDPAAFEEKSVQERVCEVLVNYLDGIRARPRTVEMLAGELLNPNDLSRVLAEGLVRPGKGVAEFIKQESIDQDISDKVWGLIYIISATATFLSVRERNNPDFLGLDLRDDETWAFFRKIIADMAISYLKS